MKNQVKLFILATALVAQVSCQKEDIKEPAISKTNTGADLYKSIPVDFANQVGPDKVLSRTQIGTATINGQQVPQFLQVVEKTRSLQEISFENDPDIAYPGSVLDGEEFEKMNLAPLTFPDPFLPVTISMSLNGGSIKVSKEVEPTLSQVRKAINELVAGQKDKIDYDFTRADIQYDAKEIKTNEEFALGLGLFAKVDALKQFLNVKAGFSLDVKTNNSSQYVNVSFNQRMFDVSVDAKHYSKWLPNGFPTNTESKKEPLYIASVTYGRMGNFFIKTNEKATDVKFMVEAAVKSACKCAGVLVDAEVKADIKFKKLFSEKKISFIIKGGPVELAGKIQTYEDFIKFITMPDAKTLVATSIPTKYKIRRIKDGSIVEVKVRIPVQEIIDGN